MGHGGKREGSGRKAGTPNQFKKQIRMRTSKVLEAVSLSPDQTPLAFFLAVMQNTLKDRDGKLVPITFKDQFEAAKEAAPYVHPRKASVEVKGDPTAPLTLQSDIGRALAELAEAARRRATIDVEAEVLEPATLMQGSSGDDAE